MRYLFIVAILLLSTSLSYAQALRVKEATRQNWAGGVAGMHGVRYNIVLGSAERVRFTRMWADGRSIALDSDNGSIKESGKGAQKVYTIHTNISYGRVPAPPTGEAAPAEPEAPIAYKGAALLAYKWRGQTKYYVVKDMRVLPPLSYP